MSPLITRRSLGALAGGALASPLLSGCDVAQNRADPIGDIAPWPRGREPISVAFDTATLFRTKEPGDNWCQTWAKDGSVVTAMCDGNWIDEQSWYRSRLYRITGASTQFERASVASFPAFTIDMGFEGSWFTYGVVSVGDRLYAAASKTPGAEWSGPFLGVKLLMSPDGGTTWHRINRDGELRHLPADAPLSGIFEPGELFFHREDSQRREVIAASAFSYFDFLQSGRGNRQSRDEFIYIYAPDLLTSNRLNLARAPAAKLGLRSAWEFFAGSSDGGASWSPHIEDRAAVHEFPAHNSYGEHFGWYSWLPSVVWNEPIGLYIMAAGGTYAGWGFSLEDQDYFDPWMHAKTGSLGFWWAKTPWGPWTQIWYTDAWTVDDDANRTYQPKLSPKWISSTGETMVLIWSDAMADESGASHTVNYTWNQMQVRFS